MLNRYMLALFTAVALTTNVALADVLEGTIVRKDGSKARMNSVRIHTSWNNQTATWIAAGEYKIDFKNKVGQKITVLVDGAKVAEIVVNGTTKLDIKMDK